ncbi:MAG: MarR family transcriptional regulator [Gammaproteobacteria bacterium]|nr:MarR family transcriptional regulator [Gammaproteobacteria bacterium]
MSSANRTTEDAFQDVLLALFRLHGQVLHAADVMSADAGLSGARWQVMKVIGRRPMTVSQVARRLGLQRQSVQRTADGLCEHGLAEVLPNVDHLRAGLIGLSPEGRRTLETLQERQQAWLGRCLRGASRAELDAVAASLAGLADRVEKATSREQVDATGRGATRARRASGVRRRLTAA